MHKIPVIALFTLVVHLAVSPQLVHAQTAGSTGSLQLPTQAQAILDALKKPLHPVIGGVAPGGGVGVGIGYTTPTAESWFHDGRAMATVNGYWSIDAEAGYQNPTVRVGVFDQLRHMDSLRFDGIGPDSLRSNESRFRLRDNAFGARATITPRPAIEIGGTVERYTPSLGPGDSPHSIETVFAPSEVPGFGAEPAFVRTRGYVQWSDPTQGAYQFALESVSDRDGGLYDFHRFELEGRRPFRGFRPGHRFSLHGLLGITNADANVPYYLMYTLGGGGLNTFRPNTIGSDGTTQTLRGFDNFRFRDRDLLLVQAEYHVPLPHGVEAGLFYDAGRVAATAGDVFGAMKQDTGFSIAYMRNGAPLVRLDVGYGGGEGVHVFWGFGL